MTREELVNRLKALTKQVYSNVTVTPEEAVQYDELTKFPELKKVIVDLLTPEYDSFLASIDWVAPRPSTFRINLQNGQNFYLIYGKRSWIAQVEGKKYYLLNLPEEERAAQSIANILRYGAKSEEGEAGGEISAELPGTETPPAEETPAEEPAPEEELAETEEVQPKTPLRFKIIKEGLKKLSEGTEEEIYDGVIKKSLGLKENEPIPTPAGNYTLKDSTFSIQVDSRDKSTFDKLYNVAPPKKGEDEGETKGVGNGEVALYWLYQYSNNTVEVGRAGDDPDLFINGKGVEVKAYKSHVGKIGLGRFGADKENLQLLSVVFGIKALSEALGSKQEKSTINPTNFKGSDLIPAFEQLIQLEKIPDLETLASQYSIFATIKQNIDTLNQSLNSPKDAQEGAQAMAYKMIESKLGRKPGDGGYLANVLKNGDIKFFKIELDKVKSNENLLDNFAAKQSAIYLDFGKIFG